MWGPTWRGSMGGRGAVGPESSSGGRVSGSGGLVAGRRVSEVVLAPEAGGAGGGGEFAAETLRRWGVPHWGEPVELVVSELVTNAVRHAGTVTTLRLVPAGSGVVVAVDDAAGGEPRL